MQEEKLVIIGSGPAALTAAIYGSRADLKPLIIQGKEPGGQLMGTTYVENWPGITSILGPDLIKNMQDHARSFGTRFMAQEVTNVDLSKRPFTLMTSKGETVRAESLIIATGATSRRLGVKGEDTYWGKGVTTCAVCDGAFYRDQKVIIVGGGDSAMENASFMTNFTKDITIVHILPELTASHAMQERILKNPNIRIIYQSSVTEFFGNGNHVTGVEIKHQKTGATQRLDAQAVFIAIGLIPNTGLFKGQLDLTPYGYIDVKNHTTTSVPGVFVAGDAADAKYRQAITSAGTGCAAALDAERFLKEHAL